MGTSLKLQHVCYEDVVVVAAGDEVGSPELEATRSFIILQLRQKASLKAACCHLRVSREGSSTSTE